MESYELIYKIDKSKSHIRLLGEEFYKRYKIFGYFIYERKKYRLIEKIGTKNIKRDEIKLLLIFNEIIYNKKHMFQDCETLLKILIPDIKDKYYCSQLIKLHEEEENLFDFIDDDHKTLENTLYQTINNIDSFPDFSDISEKQKNESEFSTVKKVYNNLESIPKIKINQYNLFAMFYNCSSLILLSDIFKRQTNPIININLLFSKCSSLKSLPDISYWNTDNITGMVGLFDNCSLLESLPDISKWNTNNVTNMNGLFNNCSSLISVPDISKWKIDNVIDIGLLFRNCSSLISLPDISKWNTKNITQMGCLF